ncbi:MAG: hypothetical protein SPH07_04320 [Eubacteriales bacterium]|jgi:hypothetical protein|nr:hypothetical protein [Eubacteriales bacterium]
MKQNPLNMMPNNELEWLALAKRYIRERDYQYYTERIRDAAFDLFYDGENLRKEFLNLIPVSELATVRYTMDILKTISSFYVDEWSGYRGSIKEQVLLENIDKIEKIMQKELSIRSNFTIFYSWQCDSDKKFNRNFIENCLSNAINRINKVIDYTLILDKNTIGESGSPDIVNVILNKIDMAIGFVADITPIVCLKEKYLSNSNVMLELGYALSSLSDERVILICNTSKCRLNDLPFDLGLKRIVSYEYDEESDANKAKNQKEKLENTLYEAIQAIINL